jgi:hypothetical protein
VVCPDAAFMTNQESFTCAYWDWLRRIRTTEPKAADYGLDYQAGEALARRCHWEFEKGKIEAIKKSAMAA